MRSSAVRGNFTSGRRPLGSSSSVLKVPIGKVFLRYRKTDDDNFEPDTLSGLQRSIQRLLSEGRSPFTVLSPFKRQLAFKRHQSSTAVNINKFSCCNKSQFKHLQGPSDSDLNSRAVFSGVDIRSISEHQFKISNGPVTIIQEPQKRRRVFIESARRRAVLIPFKLYFLLTTRPHGF